MLAHGRVGGVLIKPVSVCWRFTRESPPRRTSL